MRCFTVQLSPTGDLVMAVDRGDLANTQHGNKPLTEGTPSAAEDARRTWQNSARHEIWIDLYALLEKLLVFAVAGGSAKDLQVTWIPKSRLIATGGQCGTLRCSNPYVRYSWTCSYPRSVVVPDLLFRTTVFRIVDPLQGNPRSPWGGKLASRLPRLFLIHCLQRAGRNVISAGKELDDD
jgi:hypothetical protein